jgi:hypothetical protein
VNTKGYEGNIHKNARVFTNDMKAAIVVLGIKAKVHAIISVKPRYVRLYGKEDGNITKSIEIRAGLDKPLTLEPAHFDLEGKVAYKIEEIDKGRAFRISFTSIPGVSGRYRGFLDLKTNYEEKPLVRVSVRGRFQKAQTKETN